MKAVALGLTVFMLSSCASLTASQGNGSYIAKCPVIIDLLDGTKQVATYMDENGKIHPAMVEINVQSGRESVGGVNAVTPCGSLTAPEGLTQGEDRSRNFMTGLGDMFRSILSVFGM